MTLFEISRLIRESKLAQWEIVRHLGYTKFVLLYGILRSGLRMWVLLLVLLYFVDRPHHLPPRNDMLRFGLVCAGLGFFIADKRWAKFEKLYAKSQQQA
jgi:hypothetical protein